MNPAASPAGPSGLNKVPSPRPAWQTFVHGGYRIHCLPPLRRFRGTEIPWDDRDELRLAVASVAKASRSRKVVHLTAGQWATPVELFVKRYNFKTWIGPLLRLVRKSRAREEFDLGWQLLDRGVRTPRPVWLAETRGPVPRFSLIATEALPEAENAVQRWRRLTAEEDRLELVHALGTFLRKLHVKGFYHDDCKAGHLLLLPYSPSRAQDFYLIDLLGGVFSTNLSPYRRAKNLYQILRSFTPASTAPGFGPRHRAAFLEAYAGSPAETDFWAQWVKRIGESRGRHV